MITRAAVRIKCPDGWHTIPCHRHNDAYTIIQEFNIQRVYPREEEQGFLTSDGVFLNRREAKEEAVKCNQLIRTSVSSELFSEDLW